MQIFYLLSLLPTLPAAALAKLTPPVGSVFFAEVGAGNPGKLDVGRETKRRGESADSVLISDTPPDDLFLFLKQFFTHKNMVFVSTYPLLFLHGYFLSLLTSPDDVLFRPFPLQMSPTPIQYLFDLMIFHLTNNLFRNNFQI